MRARGISLAGFGVGLLLTFLQLGGVELPSAVLWLGYVVAAAMIFGGLIDAGLERRTGRSFLGGSNTAEHHHHYYARHPSLAEAMAMDIAPVTQETPLVITSAKYGVPGKEADVKDRLTELIEDGVLDFEASLAYLLVDPAPGEFKTLRIRWLDRGKPDASAYHENTHIVIPRSAAREQ